jgi:hypothetical protein
MNVHICDWVVQRVIEHLGNVPVLIEKLGVPDLTRLRHRMLYILYEKLIHRAT